MLVEYMTSGKCVSNEVSYSAQWSCLQFVDAIRHLIPPSAADDASGYQLFTYNCQVFARCFYRDLEYDGRTLDQHNHPGYLIDDDAIDTILSNVRVWKCLSDTIQEAWHRKHKYKQSRLALLLFHPRSILSHAARMSVVHKIRYQLGLTRPAMVLTCFCQTIQAPLNILRNIHASADELVQCFHVILL